MADQYLLRVTAGSSYDTTTHQTVQVNKPTPTHISTAICDAKISVRIQNYRGLPHKSPTTSAYFSHALHLHDQYSIAFTLLPHKSFPGSALVFGNSFDRPIRDRLPPGTSTALRIVKWAIDPGLDGDLYSDTPHLYGNALSSVNILRVGEKVKDGKDLPEPVGEEKALEEGGDGEGEEWRKSKDVPETGDARKKHFLSKGFSLKLPGFSLSVLPYLGGTDYLRYVLKIKDTDEVLFVVVFSLLHKEDVEKEEAEPKKGGEDTKVTIQDSQGARHEGEKDFEPEADDLD